MVVQVPLVGAVGQDYVHTVLQSMDPQSALKEIQRRGAFKNKRCEPLLRLLDHLGLQRYADMLLSIAFRTERHAAFQGVLQ